MEIFNVEIQGNQGELSLHTQDNKKIGRILLQKDGGNLIATSTVVMPEFEGKGYAKQLFNELVSHARNNNFKIVPKCPYILAQFEKKPNDFADIWA